MTLLRLPLEISSRVEGTRFKTAALYALPARSLQSTETTRCGVFRHTRYDIQNTKRLNLLPVEYDVLI